MSKQRVAELEAELERLRERIAALEARPATPIWIAPYQYPQWH